MKKNKDHVLVPENDTHKQTITDVYNIFKTTYTKCYDSDEELFYCDVVHHLEMHSASTNSETNSRDKYKVDDPTLKNALAQVPKWYNALPKHYGTNTCVSMSCRELPDESPMNHLKDMGIRVIEYVKLRIGYTYLKSSMIKSSAEKNYTKAICPGLVGGAEDPVILRMLHMQYINRDEYMKWMFRSRKKDDTKRKEKSDDNDTVGFNQNALSDSAFGKQVSNEVSNESVRVSEMKNFFSTANLLEDSRIIKDDLPPPSADEKRVIMLTQYEVIDQELPDDIEIFWPGKRDLENDYISFKTALYENILHQEFIQKYKSGKLERLDDDNRMEGQQYFVETRECRIIRQHQSKTPYSNEKKRKLFKCNFDRLKEQFKDYQISQEYTLSLFENVTKEKIRLEDLNLCCIISKLKDLHKENPDDTQDGQLIWKDVVVIKTKSKEFEKKYKDSSSSKEPQKESKSDEEEPYCVPEYKSLIYLTKIYPDSGEGYLNDKCISEREVGKKEPEMFLKGGCTGYSMKDYKPPLIPQCNFKIATDTSDDNISDSECPEELELESESSKQCLNPDGYITFHTDWPDYPYSEMLDIVFHRHHKGYVYMMDKFEITPDVLREINRIFHKAGKYSEKESRKTAVKSYICHDPQARPVCCHNSRESLLDSKDLDPHEISLPPSQTLKTFEDIVTIKNTGSNTRVVLHDEKQLNLLQKGSIEYIGIQNLLVSQEHGYTGSSSGSSATEDLKSYPHFVMSQVSSVCFDSHENYDQEFESTFSVNDDYNDSFGNSTINPSQDENDEYSDIVDFIKNFRFGEDKSEQIKNYEGIQETKHEREKGVFVDISSTRSHESPQDDASGFDEISVNSDDTLSLGDFEGFLGKEKHCKHKRLNYTNPHKIKKNKNTRIGHCVHGEFFDIVLKKRRSIIQELRTSIPLIYLYLTLKQGYLKKKTPGTLSISGKLEKYKKYFHDIDREYDRIALCYKLKYPPKFSRDKITNNINHHNLVYDEIIKKKVFNEEIYSLIVHYPYIRHLFIREAFQDVGTNLSFLLLHFIENDKSTTLSTDQNDVTKTVKEVGKFLCEFRDQKGFRQFLIDMILLHYFQTRHFFSITNIIERDCDWEEIFKMPRLITDWSDSAQAQVTISFKDSTLQKPTEYSYIFYNFIKQLNINFYENDLFKQFLEPELHPKCFKNMTYQEMDEMITKDCLEWCDQDLIGDLNEDLERIMITVWESEILGFNRCKIYISQFKNRFVYETGFYLRDFFPNIIKIETEIDTEPKNPQYTAISKTEDIWLYNREFDFWYNQATRKSNTSDDFLKKDNLFKFEKLITKCLIRSILTFYDFRVHG